MPIDFDTDIRDALFVGTVDAEEPYASVIADAPALSNEMSEQGILALIATMHGYMTTLRDRDEARLAHYTMSRMLTKYGSGGFVYDDLSITERGNVCNPLFDPGDTFDFDSDADGASDFTVAVGGAGTLADAVSALNGFGSFTGAGFSARSVNGKLEISRAETAGTAESTDFDPPAASSFNTTGAASHFLLNTPARAYYVWYNITDAGTEVDPGVAGRVGIRVDVLAADTAATVATKTATALDAQSDLTSSDAAGTVTVTNDEAGNVSDLTDVDASLTGITVTDGTPRVGAGTWQLLIGGVAARKAGFQTGELFRNDAERVAAEARQEAVDIFLKEARGNRLI